MYFQTVEDLKSTLAPIINQIVDFRVSSFSVNIDTEQIFHLFRIDIVIWDKDVEWKRPLLTRENQIRFLPIK